MSTSIHVSLLLLLAVLCFNSLTFGDSFVVSSTPSIPIISHQSHHDLNDSKINVIVINIVNDLPIGTDDVYLKIGSQSHEIHLGIDDPFTLLSNFETKEGLFIFDTYVKRYAKVDLYNPRTDGDHRRIFWSVRLGGAYHSWDNVNWELKAAWHF